MLAKSVARNHQRPLANLLGQRLGLFDLGGEKVGADGAAVNILQGDPAAGEDPVEFDDPAHQVGIGLLPERFLALAE